MLHGLKRADEAVELLALIRVCNGLFDHRFAGSKNIGGQCDSSGIKGSLNRIPRALKDGHGAHVLKDNFRRTSCLIRQRESRPRHPSRLAIH